MLPVKCCHSGDSSSAVAGSRVVHVARCDTSCFLQYSAVRYARCIVGIQIQRRRDSGEHKGMKTAPRKLLTPACCDVNSCERSLNCEFWRLAG